MLLGAHRDAFTVGELKATNLGDPQQYRCSCGQMIQTCVFWAKVSSTMASKGFTFDITSAGTNFLASGSPYVRWLLRPLHRGRALETLRDLALSLSPHWREHVKCTQRRNTVLIETLQELSGAQVIIDSSKIDLQLKYLLRNRALDVRVIRLIRDGRGVALTYMNPSAFADARYSHLRGGGGGMPGPQPELPRASIRRAAHEWRRSNEAAECLVARLKRSQWMEVHYEELCTQPETTLRRICEFLELEPNKLVYDFRTVEQHIIGNGMRFDTSSQLSPDERWREHLTEEDLRSFDATAGDLNRKYGYV